MFSSDPCECTHFRFADVNYVGSYQWAHRCVIHFLSSHRCRRLLVRWGAFDVDALSSVWHGSSLDCPWIHKQTHFQPSRSQKKSHFVSTISNDFKFLLDVWDCSIQNLHSSIYWEPCRLLQLVKIHICNSDVRIPDSNAPVFKVPFTSKSSSLEICEIESTDS